MHESSIAWHKKVFFVRLLHLTIGPVTSAASLQAFPYGNTTQDERQSLPCRGYIRPVTSICNYECVSQSQMLPVSTVLVVRICDTQAGSMRLTKYPSFLVSTALLAEIENESSPVSAPCRPNTVVQNEECHYPGAGIDRSDWALPTLQTDEYLTNRIVEFKSWKCCSNQPTSEKWIPNRWKGTTMFCLEVPWKTQFITIEATSLIKGLRIYWDASNISRSWKPQPQHISAENLLPTFTVPRMRPKCTNSITHRASSKYPASGMYVAICL